MKDDGDTKDDVKLPEGDLGVRILKMFREEEKDVSKYSHILFHVSLWQPGSNLSLDIIIQTAMGEEAAIEAKEAPK
jgi:translation initiation factor 5A